MTFPSINPALDRALAVRDYATPTAVQLAVMAPDAAARDLLVSAQTGSGKTVAFGLAMARAVLGDAERLERAAAPLALIIAPTRELAMQVQRELAWLYADTGARIVTSVGGMDPRAEARQLAQGAHIVVGTPGRLRDHLERRRLDLSGLRSIVLDEADEMLDLGFREDLELILDATPATRQTLMFSATVPREIEAMARRYQRDALRIETIDRHEQHADIAYTAIRVVPGDAENAVVNVLRFHEPRAALVFCTTREAVKRMHARLVERGFAAVALSGELTQHERTQALVSVRDGRARVLVATDVAARGLDLPDLALVVHAELPNDRETLLHRSGRTGRAGRKGLCVLIVPHNRRRKAEGLLAAARLQVTWGSAPTVDEIRAMDQERLLADPVFADAATDAELGLARILQAGRSPDEIALALVRLYASRLPEPEDIAEDRGPPRRHDRPEHARPDARHSGGARSWERRERAGAPSAIDAGAGDTGRGSRPPRRPRDEDREMVWFRLNIGRNRNADPRWILPIICKAGGITKSEIGSIKIHDRETRFQIAADHADRFEHTVRTSKHKEGHIVRVGADAEPANETVDDRAGPAPGSAMPAAAHMPRSRPKPSRRDVEREGGRGAPRRHAGKSTPREARAPAPDAGIARGPGAGHHHERKSREPAN